MNKTISEAKIRSVVRQELRSFLISEGFWDNVKNVASTAFQATGLQDKFAQGQKGKTGFGDALKAMSVHNQIKQSIAANPEIGLLQPKLKELIGDNSRLIILPLAALMVKNGADYAYAGADLTVHANAITQLEDYINQKEAIQKKKYQEVSQLNEAKSGKEDKNTLEKQIKTWDKEIKQRRGLIQKNQEKLGIKPENQEEVEKEPKIEELIQKLTTLYGFVSLQAKNLYSATKKEGADPKDQAKYYAFSVIEKLINNIVKPMIDAEDLVDDQIAGAKSILNIIKVVFTKIRDASTASPAPAPSPAPSPPTPPTPSPTPAE